MGKRSIPKLIMGTLGVVGVALGLAVFAQQDLIAIYVAIVRFFKH